MLKVNELNKVSNNINIKDFCNLFMEPLEKVYKKKDVVKIANVLLGRENTNG